jgi:hypothetical protein
MDDVLPRIVQLPPAIYLCYPVWIVKNRLAGGGKIC